MNWFVIFLIAVWLICGIATCVIKDDDPLAVALVVSILFGIGKFLALISH